MPVLSDGMLAILRRMQRRPVWKMARQIGATSPQYDYLIRHGYIVRREAEKYGTSHRWEYMLTVQGKQQAEASGTAAASPWGLLDNMTVTGSEGPDPQLVEGLAKLLTPDKAAENEAAGDA